MSVLRDATYATLGARASLGALETLDRTLRYHMTGLHASHAHTCAHAFAYFRAAEALPSLLSSLLDLSGLIQGFAREKGLFRGLFRLCRFFLFFSTRQSPTNFNSARRAPPLCQLLIRHTSYVTSSAHAARLLRCRGPRTKPRKHTILTASLAPFTRHLPIHQYSFYYSTLHSCLSSPCPTRASLGAF